MIFPFFMNSERTLKSSLSYIDRCNILPKAMILIILHYNLGHKIKQVATKPEFSCKNIILNHVSNDFKSK